MPIVERDIVFYGSASMPDDDTATAIGGAISTSKRVVFTDLTSNGNLQIVSSSASDITPTVTVDGRNAAGVLINEVKTLNGTTPVAMTTNTTWERILKGVKSGTTVGDVAIEAVTATTTGTAQAGAAGTLTLAAGASGTDNFYRGMVLRTTGGTGPNQIRNIIAYNGTTKVATVDRDFGTTPDATTTYTIGQGMYFEKSPAEALEVRTIFYNAAADVSGGATRNYYEKIFAKNTHGTLTLTSAQIQENADPSGKITFTLETTLDGTGTNGTGNNRQVAPSAGVGTFDSANKNVANSQNHTAGAAQGIWLKLTLAAGDAAAKTSYTLRETGTTT